MLRLENTLPDPVVIDSVELLRRGDEAVVRCRSKDGAEGLAVTTRRIHDLYPILTQRVAPYFVGRDARDLSGLIDGVYRHRSNYKLVGLPLWCCVAWVEFSVIDMLGQLSGKSAVEMLGGSVRDEVAVYLSQLSRKLTPQAIVDQLKGALATTGARAVKVKIGGRMSQDVDASPGRTEALIPLLRRELGNDIAIYVDANGSFSVERAIEVGRMLEANGVTMFEEPCPFQHYEDTRRVAETLSIPVAGGEQDSDLYRWEQNLRDGVFDVPQPDLMYNGGFLRTAQVAAMAAAAGRPVCLHNPHRGAAAVYMTHFVAATPTAASFHEWNAEHRDQPWYEPGLQVRNGVVRPPTGPGFGLHIDLGMLRRMQVVASIRRLGRKIFPLKGTGAKEA